MLTTSKISTLDFKNKYLNNIDARVVTNRVNKVFQFNNLARVFFNRCWIRFLTPLKLDLEVLKDLIATLLKLLFNNFLSCKFLGECLTEG